MARTRVEMNRNGINNLLTSHAVLNDLMTRAQAVADEADRTAVTPSGMVRAKFIADADITNGDTRARAAAYTGNIAAMHTEAKHRTLLNALDAGR